MAARRKTRERSAVAPERRRKGWLRLLARVAIVVVLAPVLLTPLYLVVPPVSTLMAYERLKGPIERQWVPLGGIAPSLVATVVMSEDGQFCRHRGVDWAELKMVLGDEGGPSRGASTIPMQTVKNLFLWSSRSYLRKALEIPLAVYADIVLGKKRMMEIYLNVVELGPGIFGVEAAAQHYFGVSAARLGDLQAALLVASLPNPTMRNPAAPGARLMRLATSAMERGRRAGGHIDCLSG